MTGRDIIKFILENNLLDKSCTSTANDRMILKFIDYLSNDEQTIYICYEDGRCRRILNDMSNLIMIDQVNVQDLSYPNLKIVDSLIADESVPTFSMTFRQWLKTLDSGSSITHYIVDYADEDSNFGNNCKTFNKMISYLEGKEVDKNVLLSAEVAWTQYLRECRYI